MKRVRLENIEIDFKERLKDEEFKRLYEIECAKAARAQRKTVHKNEWWFIVNDVVLALTDSLNVPDYIKKMRKRDNELSKGWGQFVTPLSVRTSGGNQKLSCANTEGIFRIIQSIPSPKAVKGVRA